MWCRYRGTVRKHSPASGGSGSGCNEVLMNSYVKGAQTARSWWNGQLRSLRSPAYAFGTSGCLLTSDVRRAWRRTGISRDGTRLISARASKGRLSASSSRYRWPISAKVVIISASAKWLPRHRCLPFAKGRNARLGQSAAAKRSGRKASGSGPQAAPRWIP